MPDGTSTPCFEDPACRLWPPQPRKRKAREELQSLISLAPAVGKVLLWES